MSTNTVKNLLTDLKLQGMLGALDRATGQAVKETWTGLELLDHLLQEEFNFREARSLDRRMKGSELKKFWTLMDFDFNVKRSLTKDKIKELYTLKWLDLGRPIVVMGPTGVGKTFTAEALAHHAIQAKKTAFFISVSDLMLHQSQARADGSYLKLRGRLAKYDILILDDFGLSKIPTQSAHDIVDLIKERIGAKSTIITTQLPIENWTEVIEDPIIADTLIDRFKHTAVNLAVTGETYRKEEGLKLDKNKN
jgi:DNA replication protein DnaC